MTAPVRKSMCRVALPAALACATVLLPSTAAAAAEPERAGWWNRASGGGLVAPAPAAAPGDLRISALAPDEPTAYAAVLFTAPGAPTATLDLKVRGKTGTPEIAACPTESTDWPEGGNQPYDKAPPYDCEIGVAFGSLSEDGMTLSFVLDTTTQTEPGVWSLALVPQPDSASGPFVLDIVEPDASVFLAAAPETSTTSSDPATESSVDSGTTSSEGGSGEAFLPGGFEPPPVFDTGIAEAPLVAGGADTPLPAPASAPEPAVVAGAPAAATPLLVARPAGVVEDLGSGRRLLALLVLAGGSAAVGYAAGQQRPGPRLIGGRSRAAVPTAVPALAGPASAEERPRGIGRFAKTRDAAPRRLR